MLDRLSAAWSAMMGHAQQPATPEWQELSLWNSALYRGWYSSTYNPSELVTSKGLEVFDKMQRDDQIKAALAFKRHAILATGWDIYPPDETDHNDPVVMFVKRRLRGMECTVERIMNDILSALAYGYSVSEIIWAELAVGEDTGRVGIADIKTRRPHDFRFDLDQYGNVKPDGLLQTGAGVGELRLPVDKFVLMTHGEAFGNPYGTSELEACYRPWWVADNAYKWLAMMLERYGIPPIVGLYNAGKLSAGQVDELKNVFTRMQAATSALLPRASKDDLELWAPELAGQVSTVFVPALAMLKQDMARALLMPGLLGVTPDSLGSYARAKVIFDVFMLSVEYTRAVLADDVIGDQVIKRLVDYNFGPQTAYPRFVFRSLTDEAQNELLRTWRELVRTGTVRRAPDDERHIRQLLGFPEREADADESPLNPRQVFSYHFGALTVNEVRAALGLEPVPWGEERAAAQAVRRSGAADSGVPTDEADPDDKPEEADTGAGDGGEGDDGGRRFAQDGPFAGPAGQDAPELTAAERRVDFAQVARRLDAAEAEAAGALEGAILELAAEVERRVRAGELADVAAIQRLAVALPQDAFDVLLTALEREFQAGREDLRAEARKAIELRAVDVEPEAALEYLRGRVTLSFFALDADVTAVIKGELLASLKAGIPVGETVDRLRTALAPFAAQPGRADLGRPARLDTIVRTITTEAYNHGRLIEARALGSALVPGMQYSAVLDDRTTAICRSLHGKRFRTDDPELGAFTPPNHYRCRSVLVPVTIGDPAASGPWITAGEKGEVATMMDSRFGGAAD